MIIILAISLLTSTCWSSTYGEGFLEDRTKYLKSEIEASNKVIKKPDYHDLVSQFEDRYTISGFKTSAANDYQRDPAIIDKSFSSGVEENYADLWNLKNSFEKNQNSFRPNNVYKLQDIKDETKQNGFYRPVKNNINEFSGLDKLWENGYSQREIAEKGVVKEEYRNFVDLLNLKKSLEVGHVNQNMSNGSGESQFMVNENPFEMFEKLDKNSNASFGSSKLNELLNLKNTLEKSSIKKLTNTQTTNSSQLPYPSSENSHLDIYPKMSDINSVMFDAKLADQNRENNKFSKYILSDYEKYQNQQSSVRSSEKNWNYLPDYEKSAVRGGVKNDSYIKNPWVILDKMDKSAHLMKEAPVENENTNNEKGIDFSVSNEDSHRLFDKLNKLSSFGDSLVPYTPKYTSRSVSHEYDTVPHHNDATFALNKPKQNYICYPHHIHRLQNLDNSFVENTDISSFSDAINDDITSSSRVPGSILLKVESRNQIQDKIMTQPVNTDYSFTPYETNNLSNSQTDTIQLNDNLPSYEKNYFDRLESNDPLKNVKTQSKFQKPMTETHDQSYTLFDHKSSDKDLNDILEELHKYYGTNQYENYNSEDTSQFFEPGQQSNTQKSNINDLHKNNTTLALAAYSSLVKPQEVVHMDKTFGETGPAWPENSPNLHITIDKVSRDKRLLESLRTYKCHISTLIQNVNDLEMELLAKQASKKQK